MDKKTVINLNEDQIGKRIAAVITNPYPELIEKCIKSFANKELTPAELVRGFFQIMAEMRDILPFSEYITLNDQVRKLSTALVGGDERLQKAVVRFCDSIHVPG